MFNIVYVLISFNSVEAILLFFFKKFVFKPVLMKKVLLYKYRLIH